MVIGPTPPGTGVIPFATLLQFSKSTSPTSFALVSPFSSILILLMPTSIITEPGLTQLDFYKIWSSYSSNKDITIFTNFLNIFCFLSGLL